MAEEWIAVGSRLPPPQKAVLVLCRGRQIEAWRGWPDNTKNRDPKRLRWMSAATLADVTQLIHRYVTHSLVVLSVLILAVAWAWGLLASVELGLSVAWAVALLSHPILDVLTTGPKTKAQGFGIPLLWPLLSRRWFVRHPVLDTGGLMACRSAKEVWNIIRAELCLLGPVPIAILLLGCLV